MFPTKQVLTLHANCLQWRQFETISVKCQSLFYRKNEKSVINLSSADFVQRLIKVNVYTVCTGLSPYYGIFAIL